MTSGNAHFEAEPLEQLAEFGEIPRCIALRIAQTVQQLFVPGSSTPFFDRR